MEPLRGGQLVKNLPEEVMKEFKNFDEKRTPAEWALRWVWNHPEVTVVLSGMNNEEQACQISVVFLIGNVHHLGKIGTKIKGRIPFGFFAIFIFETVKDL